MEASSTKVKAFTLAEVLITLGIIGIVAEMTIPVLYSNVQDAQFKAAMKKNYSVFSGLYQRVQADNGTFVDILVNCTAGDQTCFKNALKPYLSYVKECDNNASSGICFPATVTQQDKSGSTDYSYRNTNTAGLILKDGTMAIFYLDSPACTYPRGSAPFDTECGWVTVDVNGFNKPNMWGKDVYTFLFYVDRVRPQGVHGGGYESCSVSSGFGCASQYLYQ